MRSDSPLQYVKGVGPRRAEAFASLGLHTVGDLLEYYPFRYELDQGEVAIEDLVPGQLATIRGEVRRISGRPPMRRCVIDDGTGTCTLRWFKQVYPIRGLGVGTLVIASGRVQLFNGLPEIVQPSVQVYEPDAVLTRAEPGLRRIGVYRGNDTIKTSLIRRTVQTLLLSPSLPVEEVLPPRLRSRRQLCTRQEATRWLHSPPDAPRLEEARRRLAYEEFLLLELAMALRRRKRLSLHAGQKLAVTKLIDERIRARFPFTLTAAQDKVVREIAADLASGRPMTRLLQGDVGSGKTVVALYACLAAVAHGKQAAVMAPTELLAAQHFRNISAYLGDSRVRFVLLRGGMRAAQRAEVLAAIERGEIDLVVGTQALIQKDVSFRHLALVVVDEQHKFGVLQRHQFRTKGPLPHYLVMTATPIPRTLAMTVFGDLDVSVLRQAPPGRGRIITRAVGSDRWNTVMSYVRGRLEGGEQAYVVCPQIGEEDEPGDGAAVAPEHAADARGAAPGRRPAGAGSAAVCARRSKAADQRRAVDRSVLRTHGLLVNGPWAGLHVGCLHGGLARAQKDETMRAFVAGELHALVATTVVEVGVDVPNATIMVIEHAERYGLSQLHQLRGRVGRGARDSLCVLVSRDPGAAAAERLGVLTHTTDGFKVAEADLRLRGPGELFGTKQHGLPALRVGNLVEDFALLEQARQDAFAIVADDPELNREENRALLPALRRMFGEKLGLIDAA